MEASMLCVLNVGESAEDLSQAPEIICYIIESGIPDLWED